MHITSVATDRQCSDSNNNSSMDVVEAESDAGACTMQERLQRRHQSRIEDAERRKEAKESHSVAEERSDYFFSAFKAERACIEEMLASCSSGADRAVVTAKLEEATASILQLQKFLNDSMVFLTQYDIRQSQVAIQKLQTSLADIREEHLPKKKFAFRARSKASDKASSDTPPPPAPPGPDAGPDAGTLTDGAAASEQCGFSNMHGVSLTKTAEELHKQDVLLTHLTDCKVRLYGSPSTLHLKDVHGCEILCGPVASSVFVDRCKNSTLGFPCQQLRTHNTTDTLVYLHVTSRAIIEDCRGVSFAPFSWSYPTLDEDFAVSGLDQCRNNWNKVDDFNWLAAGTPSPNWTVIPEADRKTNWDT